MNVFSFFIGKEVLIEAEGHAVLGKLIHYDFGDKRRHIPQVLILQSLSGSWIIVRFWQVIKTL